MAIKIAQFLRMELAEMVHIVEFLFIHDGTQAFRELAYTNKGDMRSKTRHFEESLDILARFVEAHI